MRRLAQLASAHGLGPWGCEFESHVSDHLRQSIEIALTFPKLVLFFVGSKLSNQPPLLFSSFSSVWNQGYSSIANTQSFRVKFWPSVDNISFFSFKLHFINDSIALHAKSNTFSVSSWTFSAFVSSHSLWSFNLSILTFKSSFLFKNSSLDMISSNNKSVKFFGFSSSLYIFLLIFSYIFSFFSISSE